MDRDDTLAKMAFEAMESFVAKIEPNNYEPASWEGDAEVRDMCRAVADAVEAAIQLREEAEQ